MAGLHARVTHTPTSLTFCADFTGAHKVALVAHQDDGRVRLGLPEEEAELGDAVETPPVSHREHQDTHVTVESGEVLVDTKGHINKTTPRWSRVALRSGDGETGVRRQVIRDPFHDIADEQSVLDLTFLCYKANDEALASEHQKLHRQHGLMPTEDKPGEVNRGFERRDLSDWPARDKASDDLPTPFCPSSTIFSAPPWLWQQGGLLGARDPITVLGYGLFPPQLMFERQRLTLYCELICSCEEEIRLKRTEARNHSFPLIGDAGRFW
ncbi:hypothetical protein EYF80_015250 [Liparis tanakae]|uniref:Uncharacterized protein n=1 Tax=Liparis tanakae TaxID=230148 RepID=A0A4Z2I9B5_9TELE|nr:hypothetical protein EYF80_015250 [Liparis tanakae]